MEKDNPELTEQPQVSEEQIQANFEKWYERQPYYESRYEAASAAWHAAIHALLSAPATLAPTIKCTCPLVDAGASGTILGHSDGCRVHGSFVVGPAEPAPSNDFVPARSARPDCVGCKKPLIESEYEYYENHRQLDRLCKQCAMEEKAR